MHAFIEGNKMDGLLTQFSDEETQLLMEMLSCVVDHADEYSNGVHFLGGDGVVRFFVERRNESVAHRPKEELVGSLMFTDKLSTTGLITLARPAALRFDWKGRPRGGEPNAFYFTPQALDLYRKRNTVDDAQVRAAIGRYVYEQYQQHPHEFLDFNVEEVARRINVASARVREQTRLLRDVGILSDIGPVNGDVELGLLQLSQEGLRWAVRGFSDDLFREPVVNVSVQINIRNVIQDIRETPVPEDVKHEAADLVKEIQEEPTIEKVSRLFGLAANVHQLAPAVIRFVTENGPALMHHLPGA